MNKYRAESQIELDGKTYPLALDLNALCEAEGYLGRAVLHNNTLGLSEIRALLWVALKKFDRRITPERAMNMVDPSKLGEVGAKIGELLAACFPDIKPDDDDQPIVSETTQENPTTGEA